MNKLGSNLKNVVRRTKKKAFTLKTVLQIGKQLLERLEALHELGYLFLDLKLDNILLGSHNLHTTESSLIYLVDFGISRRYLDHSFEHIPKINKNTF